HSVTRVRQSDWVIGVTPKKSHLEKDLRVVRCIKKDLGRGILLSTSGTVMTRALVEPSLEFDSIKYGMVAATKSSIKEMLKGVKVEAGDE
ncbi:hypothetical protein Golax_009313, partial [Gossypium laxum]|nr:hypothetical protein [Gossypium laxum]